MSSTEQKVTRSEMFAGVACFLSACTLIFNLGVVWGQTQDNTRRITSLESKMDRAVPDIAGMKADIKFLVAAEQRRQAKEGR